MMTTLEQQIAVCEKLPELVGFIDNKLVWLDGEYKFHSNVINWPTEGLQVCHEAEKLLDDEQFSNYREFLIEMSETDFREPLVKSWSGYVSYEQRLLALCRVWFPERFTT